MVALQLSTSLDFPILDDIRSDCSPPEGVSKLREADHLACGDVNMAIDYNSEVQTQHS